MTGDEYKKALKVDSNAATDYYKKFLRKSEQQKFLEDLIVNKYKIDTTKTLKIADIACGGGTLSYHLNTLFKRSSFYLLDYNSDAIKIAKEININNSGFNYYVGDLYNTNFEKQYFDFTFCWQTLSWIENPKSALKELIRITKRDGYIFLSSLFNIEHDVDLFCQVIDKTRKSGRSNLGYAYNTYSKLSIKQWINEINKSVKEFEIYPFDPQIDLLYEGRGIGTYTQKTITNRRLQFSAGMLLNWGVLVIKV